MKHYAICAVLLLFLAGIQAGCKKKREFNGESGQSSVDARMVQGENDEVVKDVNIAIMEDFLLRGRSSVQTSQVAGTSLCGVILDTTKVMSGIITLNYNGTNCFGRTRTGSVRFTIQKYPLNKWKNSGSVVRIEFINYKMVRSSDGKSVEINGVEEMTNLSGNTWFELWYLSQPSVVYSVSGSELNVKFDNTATAIFSFHRKLTYTYSGNVTTCRVEGTGSHNGKSNLENWGQTRDGTVFTSEIIEAPVWKTECGAMAPVSGQVSVQEDGKEFDLKCFFGVKSNGEISNETCPFGFRVEWSRKKRTNTRTFGYY
jgi:hypothetical protein